MLFTNYMKTSLRNLWRYRAYTMLNVIGLSIGVAACVLAMMYVRREMSVDAFHKDGHRIYRVIRETKTAAGEQAFQSGAAGGLAAALEGQFPEVDRAIRVWAGLTAHVEYGERHIHQLYGMVDSDFFEFFSLPLEIGDPATVLTNPYSIVISRSWVQSLFGAEDPIGKVVHVKGRHAEGLYTVTGISRRPSDLSHLDLPFVISTPAHNTPTGAWEGRTRTTATVAIYMRLREEARLEALASKMPALLAGEAPTEYGEPVGYHFVPIGQFHWEAKRRFGFSAGFSSLYTDPQRLYAIGGIAVFILAIACANFVNLSTARGMTRAREVGMRKVVGARRSQLIGQFLGEAMVLVLGAALLGLALVELSSSWFAGVVGGNTHYSPALKGWVVGAVPLLVVAVGGLAGIYPALFLSRFDVARVLKGGDAGVLCKGAWLRKGLVVVQFALTVLLLAGAGTVHLQTRHIMNANLGFDTDHLLILPVFGLDDNPTALAEARLSSRYESVKEAFLRHPNVLKATAYAYLTGTYPGRPRPMRSEGSQETFQVPLNEVDEDFLDTFGIPLVEGRDFERGPTADLRRAYIVNEAAVRAFGWDEALGKQIEWVGSNVTGTVIGVMKDFHTQPLREAIGPVIFCKWDRQYRYLGLKVEGGEGFGETLAFLETTWKQFLPRVPFHYRFMDEDVARLYENERRLGQITSVFAGLAMLVACLGLVGLVAFSAERRTKEIGIRKVLGASASGIVLLLSRDFVKLVLIANLIAWPVAYYAMNRWLENFAYRMELGWEVFVLSGGLALLIALLTVSGQAWRAARANPVDALRNE